MPPSHLPKTMSSVSCVDVLAAPYNKETRSCLPTHDLHKDSDANNNGAESCLVDAGAAILQAGTVGV